MYYTLYLFFLNKYSHCDAPVHISLGTSARVCVRRVSWNGIVESKVIYPFNLLDTLNLFSKVAIYSHCNLRFSNVKPSLHSITPSVSSHNILFF